jgi:hypothetical protein
MIDVMLYRYDTSTHDDVVGSWQTRRDAWKGDAKIAEMR